MPFGVRNCQINQLTGVEGETLGGIQSDPIMYVHKQDIGGGWLKCTEVAISPCPGSCGEASRAASASRCWFPASAPGYLHPNVVKIEVLI